MAWNDNIGHPIVTKPTTVYMALVEGFTRKEENILNLMIYGDLQILITYQDQKKFMFVLVLCLQTLV
jgi:hypothetical protein